VDKCVGVLQRDVRKLGVGIPAWLLQNSDYHHQKADISNSG